MKRALFPFSAVMGQEDIKNAIIWNLVNPKIGGVLISGQKGTAKSTLVRACADICDKKVIELPLNVTEDRLVGAVDFEKAIKYGVKTLDKGILYYADGNILYADEINLLSENIVKAMLELSSDNICRVEREGISDKYSSNFILIGSMNPEESGLRPQLLDRFGLYVDVVGEDNALVRCEIIRRRIAFEQNPDEFRKEYEAENRKIFEKILTARKRLKDIRISENALKIAAGLAADANCQGSRGEIAIVEAAKAICALNGSSAVNKASLIEAARFALPHRTRDMQQNSHEEDRDNSQNEDDDDLDDKAPENQYKSEPRERDYNDSAPPDSENDTAEDMQKTTNNNTEASEKTDDCGESFEVCRWLKNDNTRIKIDRGNGRRSLVKTNLIQGRYVRSASVKGKDIAFDATLRAAAPYQTSRARNGLAFSIEKSDFRIKVREKRTGNFILFVVDASGSMGAGKRMTAVKGAILSLLSDAYQKRDKVAMITFRNEGAQLALGMTRSVDLAAKKLEKLSTGGKTPLYAGLSMAHELVKALVCKEKELMPVIVLVSDGRATFGKSDNPLHDAMEEAKGIAADKIKTVVIDVEQDFIRLRLAEKIAYEMNADVYSLSGLHSGAILSAVRQAIN
ncbi:MAG: VWA domain-containing protein [Ruminiclostridium sp.]